MPSRNPRSLMRTLRVLTPLFARLGRLVIDLAARERHVLADKVDNVKTSREAQTTAGIVEPDGSLFGKKANLARARIVVLEA